MEGKLQMKKVLQDHFGRIHNYLRLSITDRCNMACTYCMPSDQKFLPAKDLLTVEEIEILCSVFVSMGISKIRLTGGEPLIREDFPEIVNRISMFGVPLSLTTNGIFLGKFIDLIREKSLSVNLSLDSLQNQKFTGITRRDVLKNIMENIRLVLNNNIPFKINMVVMRSINDVEIPDFVKLTLHHPVEVRFIEFMPFPNNHWNPSKYFSRDEILESISRNYTIRKEVNSTSATAELFRVKGAQGRFGIIATASYPFCESCNRIRITADGKIKNCLFGLKEYDLRSAIPEKEKIKRIILQALSDKHFQHGGNSPQFQTGIPENYKYNRTMTSIGG